MADGIQYLLSELVLSNNTSLNKTQLLESIMKSGAFKSRQDFYSLNQLITLDATFTKLFGEKSATVFRKMLVGKLDDPTLLV